MNFPDDVPESNMGSNGRKFYLDAVLTARTSILLFIDNKRALT